MAGGKITERAIHGPAEPATSPAGTGTGTDADSREAGRQPVVRPAALEGLGRLSVSAPPADAATGLALRRAALPVLPLAAGTLQTAEAKALDRVLKYGATWRTLVRSKLVDTDRRLDLARKGMKSTETGLDALASLIERDGLSNADALQGELFNLRAEAAIVGVGAYHRMLNEEWDARTQGLGTRSGDAQAAAVFSELLHLMTEGTFKDAAPELTRYRAALNAVANCCKPGGAPGATQALVEGNLPRITAAEARCRSALQSVGAVAISCRAYDLIKRAAVRRQPEIIARAGELLVAMKHRHDELAVAVGTLDALAFWYPGAEEEEAGAAPPEWPDRRQLAGYKALIREYSDKLDRVGMRLCLDAVDGIDMNDTAGPWAAMIDVAHLITVYKGLMQALCEGIRGGNREPATVSEASERASVSRSALPPLPAPVARAEDPQRADPGKQPVADPVSVAAVAIPAAAAVPRAPDPRTAAQKEADDLLRGCPVDCETAVQFRGDVVAIACAFGKDTSGIERLMNDREESAAVTATSVRKSVECWFGERERLEKARGGLSKGDPRNGLLTDRLRALEMIGQYVNVWEADAAKRALLPKTKHLERLLEMNEIERIDMPVRLRPRQDRRSRDRVFEIRIQPKPLSNRDKGDEPANGTNARQDDDRYRAWPLFVHLHTSRPVGADELHRLNYRDFDAVHLKLDWQKNLGQGWERMMRALGYADAKVERAKVGRELLGQLFDLAGCGGASASAAAGRAGRIGRGNLS
ncbi:hypothetical protein [Ralstonia solanacearum]|uniref:Type III effector protein (Hlk2) n=2 Tax=Ralstonia solanacearum TaxID=305 RepID=A0A5H2PPU4_RALSL|nr:hypothetical protein [Ralstonia solanacearum]AEG70843.1 putative type III effector protein (Hlk2) [Ralstonia solanacearum Po82]AMP72281.1 type III effector protein (hlk2) [Ralstonia solanacearum]AMP76881.1 type III effector protein (hlk2) [Ralstonia solanacearum]AYB62334.1 type III effector protein (hlk2) [Ralstonia solanacearum]EUJ13217.1 type III effector protein (hlk2) [Ralstonia solanacearum P673]